MNKEYFENIYLKYYFVMLKFALRIVGDDSAAEDIVQDVFADLWFRREEIDITTSVKPYLYKVCHNKCLDYIKLKDNRNIPLSDKVSLLEEIIYTTYTSHDELHASEFENELTACIKQLPERCREVFILSRWDNLKYREISERLDISVKTVEKHISKAMQLIREHLIEKDFLVNIIPLFLFKIFIF